MKYVYVLCFTFESNEICPRLGQQITIYLNAANRQTFVTVRSSSKPAKNMNAAHVSLVFSRNQAYAKNKCTAECS